MDAIHFLDALEPKFPDTAQALEEPNGLLAVGGNLAPETLISAYKKGIFPWFSDDQPLLWWSPNPRMILIPSELHIGRSLSKAAKKRSFEITVDQAFEEVMHSCAEIERPDQDGTWINDEMLEAYVDLFDLGFAHSVEAWQENRLVGGLYGVSIGKAFFGESMFSRVSGASKHAFASLAIQLRRWDFDLIDCQIHTQYLQSFGAKELNRVQFEKLLSKSVSSSGTSNWTENWTLEKFGYDGSRS